MERTSRGWGGGAAWRTRVSASFGGVVAACPRGVPAWPAPPSRSLWEMVSVCGVGVETGHTRLSLCLVRILSFSWGTRRPAPVPRPLGVEESGLDLLERPVLEG